MILVVVFAVIGICLLISGGILVGSVKKLSGNDTAKKNIENVGIFMNILPGITACLLTAFFIHKARQPGVSSNISPIITVILTVIFGVCLIISGGITIGSIKKLSGDDNAKNNINRVGTWINLVPGIFIILSTIMIFMYNRRNVSVGPMSSISSAMTPPL